MAWREAFRNENKEGCEVIGYLEVNRVPGSFSVSPGRSLQIGFAHVQLQVRTDLNLSHTINTFAFGEGLPRVHVSPGPVRPRAPAEITCTSTS